MKSIRLIIIVIYCMNNISCNKNEPHSILMSKHDNITVINYDSKRNTGCVYLLDDSIRITTKLCFDNDLPIGDRIEYFTNGLPKSVISFFPGKRDTKEIYYYENGMVYKTLQTQGGKVNGILKIYYPDGVIKAINLVYQDSIFYIRAFKDSIGSDYSENIIPIISFESDTIHTGDTVEYLISLPFGNWNGMNSSNYLFHYDDIPVKDLYLGYFIPRNQDTFSNDIIKGAFIPKQEGSFQFFGYTSKINDTLKQNLVKKNFYVVPK